MYKYYICVIMSQDTIKEILDENLTFHAGTVSDPKVYQKLEDYLQQPVIFLRQSTADENEVLILTADGLVQTNPITKKRIVIINGTADNLKIILTDLINNRNEDPETTFKRYSYGCSMPEQLLLKDWFYETYK